MADCAEDCAARAALRKKHRDEILAQHFARAPNAKLLASATIHTPAIAAPVAAAVAAPVAAAVAAPVAAAVAAPVATPVAAPVAAPVATPVAAPVAAAVAAPVVAVAPVPAQVVLRGVTSAVAVVVFVGKYGCKFALKIMLYCLCESKIMLYCFFATALVTSCVSGPSNPFSWDSFKVALKLENARTVLRHANPPCIPLPSEDPVSTPHRGWFRTTDAFGDARREAERNPYRRIRKP
ncbi:hypothetical protein T484DRAFT_3640086 [Baffinella frigidus]|nr:hypothetical protein T484DRAFT_3640086 [Cryptophyta sp. CCMP2293]